MKKDKEFEVTEESIEEKYPLDDFDAAIEEQEPAAAPALFQSKIAPPDEGPKPVELVADDKVIKEWLGSWTARVIGKFDVVKVVAVDFQYPQKVLALMMRALKPGGKLLVKEQYKDHMRIIETMKSGGKEDGFFVFFK